MRPIMLAAVIALATSANASAQSLPYDLKTASCDEILSHTNDNNATKRIAAGVYVHGMHMGNRCMSRDYVRGFELLDELGARRDMVSLLSALEAKANTGNPSAKSQLRELEQAGWIKRLRP